VLWAEATARAIVTIFISSIPESRHAGNKTGMRIVGNSRRDSGRRVGPTDGQ
jgi:hypothetical protein